MLFLSRNALIGQRVVKSDENPDSEVNIQCFGNTVPDTLLGSLHQYQKHLDWADLCVLRRRKQSSLHEAYD